ncbi:MAG: hypothetical protein ACJASB_000894 [Shewanella psychromarinicola]|jgi:hypothetical protein
MDFSSVTYIKVPDSLKKHLAKGDIVPLIGAGVSMSIKTSKGENVFPSWSGLLKMRRRN